MLTPRQEEIYRFIISYLINYHSTPTCAAIGKEFNFGANAAGEHLRAIRKKGFTEQIASGKRKSNYKLTKLRVVLVDEEK